MTDSEDPQLRFYWHQLMMISDALDGFGNPFIEGVSERIVLAAIELDGIIGGNMRERIVEALDLAVSKGDD